MYNPDDEMLGIFSKHDGTIEFYGRINSILKDTYRVLDIGAGRGAWFYEDQSEYRRLLRTIRGKVDFYVAADVDEVVLKNPATDANFHIVEGVLPFGDGEFDLVICDYVFEHIIDVDAFISEVARVLKVGGVLCARTPHKFNYVSIVARMVSNVKHSSILSIVQPSRKSEEDVFPTAYKLNSLSQISVFFKGWQNFSYIYSNEPRYYFGKKIIFDVLSFIHKLLPEIVTGNLFIFLKKV